MTVEQARKVARDYGGQTRDYVTQEQLDAVLEALQQKTEGVTQFGVGDVFKRESYYFAIEEIEPGKESSPYFLRFDDDSRGWHTIEDADILLFPTSRIPKELGGIHCEPKGDVVELDSGTVGIVTGIDMGGPKQWLNVLCWYSETKFCNCHVSRRTIKRVIWKCDESI